MANSGSFLHDLRLDQSLCHLPVPTEAKSGQRPACAMCRWATGNQFRAQVSYCVSCNTVLCVWCYKTFHTVENLEEKKDAIGLEILRRKAE